MPGVALLNAVGISAVERGQYSLAGEVAVQRIIAACLMAILAVELFAIATLQLPVVYSAFLVLATSFGTPILSTAALGLWGHSWEIFFDGWIVLLLLRAETDSQTIHPMLLASLLSWTWFVRPDSAIVIAAVTVYVWTYYRTQFPAYAAVGAAWRQAFSPTRWQSLGRWFPITISRARI